MEWTFRPAMFPAIALVMSLLLMTSATSHEDLQPSPGWSHQLVYGATANLSCTNHDFSSEDHPGARYQWLLPSGDLIDQSTVLSYHRYTFVTNGSRLLIDDIDKSDFGVYHCLVTEGSDPHVIAAVKHGINENGPYFGDMSEKYMPKLRIGLVAGGVVLVFMSMLCYNYTQFELRHDKPASRLPTNDKRRSLGHHLPEKQDMAHVNPAFDDDNTEGGDLTTNNLQAEGGTGGKAVEPATHF